MSNDDNQWQAGHRNYLSTIPDEQLKGDLEMFEAVAQDAGRTADQREEFEIKAAHCLEEMYCRQLQPLFQDLARDRGQAVHHSWLLWLFRNTIALYDEGLGVPTNDVEHYKSLHVRANTAERDLLADRARLQAYLSQKRNL